MRILKLIPLLLIGINTCVYAQHDKQTDTLINNTIPFIKADKVDFLNNVDVIFNTQMASNSSFTDGEFTGSKFAINQFRLEIKGKIYKDKVFFRFRDRYTRDPATQSVDNISRSTDLAFIGYEISDRTSLAIGKMTANWGGYEFDMNPIDIFQYNDFTENSDNFLTGVQFNWQATPNHTLSAQILNSRTKGFYELYDTIPDVSEAKFPAAYVGTWNGRFAEGKFQTIWSFSILQEASKNGKPVNMYYTALGNQFSSNKWLVQYDFKWSVEDLDRTGTVSTIIPDNVFPHAAQHVHYVEHWLRTVYSLNSQWKVSFIAMVNTSSWKDRPSDVASSRLRTSWCFIPAVEFYPIKNYNLKFFGAASLKYINYSSYAKTNFNQANGNYGTVSIGIIAPLLVL